MTLRRQIQETLRDDIAGIWSGKTETCSALRNLVGKQCIMRPQQNLEPGERDPQDMSVGYQDAADLYARLMAISGYNPMTIDSITSRALLETGESEIPRQTETNFSASLPPVSVSEQSRVRYPDSWQTGFIDLHDPELGYKYDPDDDTSYRYQRTSFKVIEAHVVVVPIDRRDIDALAKALAEGGLMPSDTSVLAKEIAVDRTIMIESGVSYHLRAVVYTPSDGHYACLIKCEDKWFDYNDLNVVKSIMDRPVSDSEVERIMSTRSSLLFYYK